MAASVLIVDDNYRVRDTIRTLLTRERIKHAEAASGTEALRHLENQEFDVALIDIKMAEMDGLELLRRIRARWPGVGVILMTAYASIPSAVEAMRSGAAHYLEKPFTKEQLLGAIEKVRAEYGAARTAAGAGSPFDDIAGGTQAITDAIELARRSAATDKPILLQGEIGSGREAMARAIHASSPRAAGPFVPVRCAAAGDGLDNELFGSPGRLLEANGGSVYLDGVSELSLDAQAKLLRFLQDGEVVRGPNVPPARSDARVIASTTEDLEELVAAGEFRQDVFFRLRAVLVRLPPLRDRRGDIPRLVQHYAKKHKPRGANQTRFSKDALKVLMTLPFRGNLKELEDLVSQAVVLAPSGEVTPEILAKMGIEAAAVDDGLDGGAMRARVEQEEKKAIEEALRRNPRNLKQTAKELNISRTTLWRKMKKYGLDGG